MNDDGNINETEKALGKSFLRLYGIVKKLRAPGGCPWDREQTPSTLRTNLVEETYECIDAIDNRDDENLREELGDIFLLVTMIGEMKEEEKSFTLEEVLNEISDKLIRRHPHVFGDVNKETVEEVLDQWEDIKENIEGKKHLESVLERIPKALPPLERALKIQKKVSRVGFDWSDIAPVWEKIEEEIGEVKEAIKTKDRVAMESEIGDLLFTVVNLSRLLKIDPTVALNRTNEKFIYRFRLLEEKLKKQGIPIEDVSLKEMDNIWNELKKQSV